jgi:hypothetical protein
VDGKKKGGCIDAPGSESVVTPPSEVVNITTLFAMEIDVAPAALITAAGAPPGFNPSTGRDWPDDV